MPARLICGLLVACSLQLPAQTPREGYITTADSARLFYRIIGHGTDTIIAIHGGPGVDLESIAGDFAPLGEKHTVIFYDQRGAGRSTLPSETTRLSATQQVADLDAVRTHFGLARVTLVAHSYGPLLAATYALAHPDAVSRMVFFGPVPPRRGDFWQRFGASMATRLDSAQVAKMTDANRRLADPAADTRQACRDFWAIATRPRLAEPDRSMTLIRSDLCASDPAGIRYGLTTTNRVVMASYGDWDLRPQLKTLAVPTLVVHGEQESIPMDLVEEWVTSLPRARLVRVPKAAHFTYAERPELVWPEVEKFLAEPVAPAARRVDRAAHHEFTIENFRTEGGATMPRAVVVYGTYGHLNAAHDNAVLLPSHYMADHHGYEWLIGPGRALDTTRLFLIATELFGNGHSSSPSNTPEPLHGPRFPVLTIRDNVEAVHRLLVDDLKITHLRAIIGFSMGAQQAFQWAVSHPTFADRIVATSGTAKTYPHGVVRLESEIAAITADDAFKGGDYTSPPTKGLEAFAVVWTAWLYSQEWWRRELWKTTSPKGTTFAQLLENYRTRFIPGADANNLILQMRTWEAHDVGTTPGFNGDVERALASIKVPLLYMPSETDLYFPVGDARYEARFIPHVTLAPIPSLWGHPAGAGASPADLAFLNARIGKFLGARN